MNLLNQSQDILEIETMIQQIDTEISFLINNLDEEIVAEIYIPAQTNIYSQGNTVQIIFMIQGQTEVRTLSYSLPISIEGGERTGFRELVGYIENDMVKLIIT